MDGDIRYGEIPRNVGVWYDEETGQWVSRLPLKPTCTSWKCQEWDGDVATAPLLVIVRRGRAGFMTCPRCGCSYGEKTPTRIDDKTQEPIFDL